SSSRSRSRSLVVNPARFPASRSAWRTQVRRVSGVQSIFEAIDRIAAHWESWSPSDSITIRTARSLTSMGNFFLRFSIAPSSQMMEPPGKPGRFTEEQIVNALKQADAGMKVEDICRKLGITPTTFYRWKAKFGGMEVNEARRLKQLEEENRRLKQLVADQAFDIQMLKAVVRKKW